MTSNFKFQISNSQKGVSLIITFLIMTVMLAIVLSLTSTIYTATKVSGNLGSSVVSLFSAHSGAEKTLYYDRKQIPAGADRGICSICSTCSGSDCTNCVTTALSSNGCTPTICDNCRITYTTYPSTGTRYDITALVTPDSTAAETNPLTDVTWGNGLFVGVSKFGYAMTSVNGSSWVFQNTPTNSWRAVTYGSGLFVAVSNNGINRVMTSPDGITWTPRAVPEHGWASIAWSEDLNLFAVASNTGCCSGIPGYIMTSPNGIDWTLQSSFSGSFSGVAYGVVNGQGMFVATTNNFSKDFWSLDGINWETLGGYDFGKNLSGVTYGVVNGSGLFVAIDHHDNPSGGYIDGVHTTSDGMNWTFTSVPVFNIARDVLYADGIFVAMGFAGGYYSSDGINWSEANIPETNYQGDGYYAAIAYDQTNGLFVAVPDIDYPPGVPQAIFSLDGINWEVASTAGSRVLTIQSKGFYRSASRALETRIRDE